MNATTGGEMSHIVNTSAEPLYTMVSEDGAKQFNATSMSYTTDAWAVTGDPYNGATDGTGTGKELGDLVTNRLIRELFTSVAAQSKIFRTTAAITTNLFYTADDEIASSPSVAETTRGSVVADWYSTEDSTTAVITDSNDVETNLRLSGPVLEIIYISVSILILVSNLVAMTVFLSSERLRGQLEIKFLISQSLVDFLAGFFLSATTLSLKTSGTDTHYDSFWKSFLCKYWYSGFPLWVMFLVSTLNLTVLSLVKYLVVVHPFLSKVHLTKTKAYLMMLIPVLVAFAFYIALFESSTGVVDGECYQLSFWPNESVRLFFGVLSHMLTFLGPVIIHGYCYGRILRVLYSKSLSSGTSSTKERAQRKVTKLLIIVVVACLACITWNLNLVFMYYLGFGLDFQSWYYNTSVILVYVNSLVNPFIYVFFYQEYRKHLFAIVLRVLCCRK